MKKILSICIAVFALGCSSDNENPENVKIRKMITETPGSVNISEYFYNGDKLDYITLNDDDRIDYTYSGDLISTVEYESESGDAYNTIYYSYDASQRLVGQVSINLNVDQGFRTEYTYNSDATVTAENFWGDAEAQDEWFETIEMEFGASGEIESTTYITSSSTRDVEYVFDNKKNPFTNVTGYDKLFMFYGTIHNLLNETWTQNSNVISERQSSYLYNAQGFPTQSTMVFNGNQYQIEYQYN